MRAISFILSVFTLTAMQPATAQITVSSSPYAPFSDAIYIRDDRANVVLTAQREMGPLGFDIDIRGWRDADNVDRVEYFCQPDTILLVEGQNGSRVHYLPYLVWRRDFTVQDDRAIVESRRVASMGTYRSLLPSEIEVEEPRADIRVMNSMMRGAGTVDTTVIVTNRARQAQRYTYIYQDAAYMWFPHGDQRSVESIRITADPSGYGRYVNQVSAGRSAPGFWQFAGTFDREHGVVGGIVTFNPEDIVGVNDEYLGLIQDNIDGEGFVHARRDFRRDDIPSTNAGAIRVEGRPINRFIALDFGTMAPDESKTLRYQRIMTVLPEGERSEDGIQRWVSSVVARIQGG